MNRAAGSITEILDSAAFARAYAITAFAAGFSGAIIKNMVGETTVTTIICTLCIIGFAVMYVRRAELSPLRVVPTSIVMLLVFTLMSATWTTASKWTWLGVLGAFGYAFVAVVIANTRDTLQTVRALGDVLRFLLALSIVIELLSGVFLDMPFAWLGVQGNLAAGGPVQGIFETRNMLGLVGVIALITFVIEWRTHSIDRRLAVCSIVMASALVLLSRSPTALLLVAVASVASLALAVVRRAPRERHTIVQLTFATSVLAAIVVGIIYRHPIIAWLGAGTDFSKRADLWNAVLDYTPVRVWQGWGYFGPWRTGEFPFWAINSRAGEVHPNALNAYFDMLIQLGAIGLSLLLLAAGLALARSWVIATERRSILYAWTPLVLISLLANSMMESTIISGVGLMLFVLCATRAGQVRSWREAVDAGRPHDAS